MSVRTLRHAPLLLLLLLLTGCKAVVLSPSGDIAAQQRDLIVISTILMLLIVVPVMVMTGWFAWRYRHSNDKATYAPEWDHSTQFELVIWTAPLLIIIALGALTWIGTHLLDPYRPLGRIDAQRELPADVKPLRVQVVAMDWKWLFVYPDYGIASVNEMAAPVDVPIEFDITASTVMNSFFVPALAGQIYAMPGMQTKLHAIINAAGDYEGFSANYSGHGFSHMRFRFAGMSGADFDAWVDTVRGSELALSRDEYLRLEQPSEREPVRHYGSAAPDLFDAVVNLCVEPNKMCMHDMMAIDENGGLGMAGIYNVKHLSYDGERRRDSVALDDAYVLSMCAVAPEAPISPAGGTRYGAARLEP
ncbi:MAG: ubiquinol oxidase subunit II [Nevskiales bacterium]|nr:ubiquinol oxidase subunit II [Nevskiales bacterium]